MSRQTSLQKKQIQTGSRKEKKKQQITELREERTGRKDKSS